MDSLFSLIATNLRLTIEWMIFFLFMGLGLYALRVIKNEKKDYLKKAKVLSFKNFKLMTPPWWSCSPGTSDNEIVFRREDTRYDWEARFSWREERSEKNIVELFKEKIGERSILFDEENCVIHNPSDFSERELIKSGRFEMVRIEGTATAHQEERLYYDAFLIREVKSGHYLYAESKSSILNGLLEGPYFEEVMLRLSLL